MKHVVAGQKLRYSDKSSAASDLVDRGRVAGAHYAIGSTSADVCTQSHRTHVDGGRGRS